MCGHMGVQMCGIAIPLYVEVFFPWGTWTSEVHEIYEVPEAKEN